MDMTPIGAAVAGGAALLAATGWRLRRRPPGGRRARAGAALVRADLLVQLMVHIQQHRGMSGAWLAGDASFAARLPDKQATVSRLFAALLEGMAEEDGEAHPCFVSNDVRLLRHQWQELVGKLGDGSPERSFQRHCRIVATLLDWLAALGEARIEQPLAGAIPPAATRNLFQRLPVLAECLGQSRALGSAVAVKRHCAPVSRVRLAYLAARCEALLGQARAAAGGRDGAACGAAHHAVAAYVAAIRERLLGGHAIGISAADYFALATGAMDAVFAWLEAEKREVAASLARPVAGARASGTARGAGS
jgi:hypothetical protein